VGTGFSLEARSIFWESITFLRRAIPRKRGVI
jgi:hypothetical protein